MSHSPLFMHAAAMRASIRQAYDLALDARYELALDACAGVLLNARGRAAGIDSRSLFEGRHARAEAYASEELVEWWGKHGRVDFRTFEAQAFADMLARPIETTLESAVKTREEWIEAKRVKRERILTLKAAGEKTPAIAAELGIPLAEVRSVLQYAARLRRRDV